MNRLEQARARRYPRRRVMVDIMLFRRKSQAMIARSGLDIVEVRRGRQRHRILCTAAHYRKLERHAGVAVVAPRRAKKGARITARPTGMARSGS